MDRAISILSAPGSEFAAFAQTVAEELTRIDNKPQTINTQIYTNFD